MRDSDEPGLTSHDLIRLAREQLAAPPEPEELAAPAEYEEYEEREEYEEYEEYEEHEEYEEYEPLDTEPAFVLPPAPQPPAYTPPSPTFSTAPQPARSNLLKKWALIGVGVVALLGVIGFLSRGTTSAQGLEIGGCYESPSSGEEFRSLKDQDCALLHDMQVFGEVTTKTIGLDLDGLVADELLESLSDTGILPTETEAVDLCDAMITTIAVETGFLNDPAIQIPEDTGLSFLEISDSRGKPEKYLCILESPSGGLVGSILDE